MPVRSLRSSVLKWPDRDTVDAAVRAWARETGAAHPEVVRIGYCGSYARGDYGPGSDVDIVVVVRHTDRPPIYRALDYDALSLPVPADVLVYTVDELARLEPHSRLRRVLDEETVWVYPEAADETAAT